MKRVYIITGAAGHLPGQSFNICAKQNVKSAD